MICILKKVMCFLSWKLHGFYMRMGLNRISAGEREVMYVEYTLSSKHATMYLYIHVMVCWGSI